MNNPKRKKIIEFGNVVVCRNSTKNEEVKACINFVCFIPKRKH